MFPQNDVRISPMAEWGCYFCSVLAMDEDESGIKWEPKEVIKLWSKNAGEGDIDYEATVLNPQGLCNDLKAGLTFVGKFGADYKCKPDEREILYFVNGSMGHFVLGDGQGKVKWDPYPNSQTVQKGRLVGKRIYRVKKK